MLLEDDSEFETEEACMEDCQETYLKLKIDTEDYLREIAISKKKEKSVASPSPHEKPPPAFLSLLAHTDDTTGISVSQDEKRSETAANQGQDLALTSSEENAAEVQNSAENVQSADNVTPGINGTTQYATPPTNADNPQSVYRMEKLKMPKFSGDVREFAIFKADFRHLVESRYSKHDAITLLRASLQGKP